MAAIVRSALPRGGECAGFGASGETRRGALGSRAREGFGAPRVHVRFLVLVEHVEVEVHAHAALQVVALVEDLVENEVLELVEAGAPDHSVPVQMGKEQRRWEVRPVL